MSGKKIKLLIYGSGNVNPINNVLENLLNWTDQNYEIDGLNLYRDSKINHPYHHFNNIFEIKKIAFNKISIGDTFTFFFSHFSDKSILKPFIFHLLNLRIKRGVLLLKENLQKKIYLDHHLNVFKLYDIVNVQCITTDRADIITYAPSKCKIILSFWGSDLMASAGLKNYKSLLKGIERADIITLSSVEMREIFLAKFGRKFFHKIHFAPFGQSDESIQYFKTHTEELKLVGSKILQENGFEPEGFEYVIKVGYSGHESQNHLLIVEQLAKLPYANKDKILLLIPMTYGATPEYIQKVRELCSSNDLRACLLTEYLSTDEALSLSFVGDIMLNLRETDGFNNSMIETLMAGKILISGGWLPYSELRKKEVYFHEIYEMDDLSNTLIRILDNYAFHLSESENNHVKIENSVSGRVNGPKWDKAYKKLFLSIE